MRRLIRPAIIPVMIMLSLSACGPWQYMTVESPRLPRNNADQPVYETDSIRVTYDMAGKDGIVTLHILNKTDQPLYVNWKKSAFIRNQQSTSFYDNNILIHGRTLYNGRSMNYNTNKPNFTATFVLPEGVDFIPPGSAIAKDLPTLAATGPLQIAIPDSLPEKKLVFTNGSFFMRYRQIHYDQSNTPIRFTVYLTFSMGKDNQEFSAINHFYVGDVFVAEGRPENFSLYHDHGDQIYIRQRSSNVPVAEGQSTASSNIR